MKMKRLGKKGKAKSQICHPSNVLQLMPILFEFENLGAKAACKMLMKLIRG